jgi:hypothetical protein
MARSFDEFTNGSSTGHGLCPRCRVRPRAGAVNIRLNKTKKDIPGRYDQLASRQISMCEECSIEIYEELVGALESETKGGTRAARAPNPTKGVETRPSTTARRRGRRVRAT